MKSPLLDEEILVCACHNTEHQLVFTAIDGDVFMTVHLIPAYGFWKRIWVAIKYIFGYRCKYGHFDEFLFQAKDAYKLYRLANYVSDNQSSESQNSNNS